MEISVQCPCGTKYKFDVEPVHGRMPMPVSCPSCGADGTGLANEFIRAASAAPAPAIPTAQIAPAVPAAPVTPAAPAASEAPPPLPAGGPRLRLSRPTTPTGGEAPPPTPPPPRAPAMTPAHAGQVVPLTPSAAQPRQKLGVATLSVMIACVAFGTWHTGYSWYQGFQSFAEDVKTASMEYNFGFEDATVLFVKHTNQVEVAEACRDYWGSNFKKSLVVLKEVKDEEYGEGLFELWNAHNGYVQLYGGLDWPEAQYEGLAEYLSKRFDTLVFEVRSLEDTGTNHFGVYEQGARKFHANIVVDENYDQKVFTEGKEWAIANGFKAGKDGFDEFDLIEADKLTQHVGMKVWDAVDAEDHGSIWLQELGRKPKPKSEPNPMPATSADEL
jgi:hypothetical protein